MMLARVGPARALALAGVWAVFAFPGVASAQRARVNTVEISPADAQIAVGQQQFFVASAYDRANNSIATATFSFTSSNSGVATVDANGIAIGVSPGTAIITARTGAGPTAKSATATLTVLGGGPVGPAGPAVQPQGVTAVNPTTAHPATGRPAGLGNAALDRQTAGAGVPIGLRVRPFEATLVRGEYLTLRYEALNANGELADRVPLVFEVDSAGRRMVEVDSVGVVKALGEAGTATVRIVVPNNPNIQPRTVTVAVRGDSVRFSQTEVWVPVGTVDTLRLIVPEQSGRPFNAPPGHFQFESSHESMVHVNAMLPVFTASAAGEARVTASGSAYYHPVITVHVLPSVMSFRATPAESVLTLVMHASRTVAAQPLAADSAVVTRARVTWIPPDTSVARFDTATGTLHGMRIGETRLGVSALFSRDSLTRRWWRIRVVPPVLAISRSRLGIGVGERVPIVVQMLDERGRPMEMAPRVRWTSANDSVARVENGQVRGEGVGRTRVTARADWDSTISADVFVSGQLLAPMQRSGRWDLHEFSADSAPRFVPITNDAAAELDPAYSPDLTRIAYVTAPPDRPASQELNVANADGSEALPLTHDSAVVGAPVFVRPNGQQIVFQSNRGGRDQLYVINRDGTDRRALTSGEVPNKQPDVSPDGLKVLYVSYRQRNYDVYEMNLDGTGERRLTTSPRPEDTPHYAPDGRSFYYLRDEGGGTKRVYRQLLVDSTGAATALTPERTFVRAFSVSADGTLLALMKFVRVRGVGDVPQVEIFNLATGVITPISVAAGDQLTTPAFRPALPAPPAAPTAGPPR